jgi:hypothetical protein
MEKYTVDRMALLGSVVMICSRAVVVNTRVLSHRFVGMENRIAAQEDQFSGIERHNDATRDMLNSNMKAMRFEHKAAMAEVKAEIKAEIAIMNKKLDGVEGKLELLLRRTK